MSVRDEPELPPRPYMPPSAAGAAVAAMVCAVVLELGWRERFGEGALGTGIAIAVSVLVGMGLVVGAIACRRAGSSRYRVFAWAGAAAILATLGCARWLARWDAAVATLDAAAASDTSFLTVGDPSLNDRGAASAAMVLDGGGAEIARVRLESERAFEAGTLVAGVARIEPLSDDDWGRSRFLKGEVASVRLVHVSKVEENHRLGLIGRIRARLVSEIDPVASPARALLAGVVCGRVTELNRLDCSDDFSRCGLSHLVAVSGSHLALVSMLIQAAMVRARAPRRLRFGAVGLVMAGYVVFTGGAPSAVRSLIMVLATLTSNAGGRRGHALSALALTVVILLAVSPGTVYDLGFQLSAMSVLAIVALGGYSAFLLQSAGFPALVAEPLSLTLCAQVATVPLTIPVFRELSLVAPLANLMVGPLMSGLLVMGLVGCVAVLAVPPLSGLLGGVAAFANLSIWLAEVLSRVPYASISVELGGFALMAPYIASVALFILWRPWSPRTLRSAMCIAVIVATAHVARWGLFAPAAITVLDVGQADAILVRDGSSTLLVDAGVDDAVLSALARQHVWKLDAVLITHWDADHWGGLPDILERLPVGRFIVAEGALASMPAELAEVWRGASAEIAYGDELVVGRFTARVVWPREPVAGEENADSLCLKVDYEHGGRELSALLTGDTELDQERAYAGDVGDIDVLKVGHHGSKVSVDEELLRELDPEVAVASAGEGNSYGHPSDECVFAIEGFGTRFLCTKDDGDVIIEPNAQGVRLTSQ